MAVIGTYNGASILAFPTKPGIKSLQIEMNDTVSMSRSPFTGATQVQAWPGADFWTVDLTLPQMVAADAAVWTAFLGECRGMLNVFPLGHPFYRQPKGLATGTIPTVSGVNPAMATVLNTKGWQANQHGLLLPGDRLQVGTTPTYATASLPGLCRLHVVLHRVDSAADGTAAISIWPSIREATTDGQAIVLNNPQGLFRLAANKRTVLSNETRLSGVNFKLLEAR